MSGPGPTTLDDAVTLLLSTLSEEEKESLRATPREELILYHFSLGLYIRNQFGLWQGNDELLRSCYPEVADPYLREIVMHDPDGASSRIIEALWERVRGRSEAA